MSTALKVLTISPLTKHTATVIFVHGLGDSGHGWKPVADMLRRDPTLGHIKWVLPHAPESPVTANMGAVMPSWFDIYEFGFRPNQTEKREDEKGMLKTVNSLNRLITDEVDSGIEANRIVLGGFSQGGAMTLLTGLTNERKLAGLVALSGWAPITRTLKSMMTDHAKQIPIFWGHGVQDPIVPFDIAKLSRDFLQAQGVSIASDIGGKGLSFNAYPGVEHSTNMQELKDLAAFIKEVIPPQE